MFEAYKNDPAKSTLLTVIRMFKEEYPKRLFQWFWSGDSVVGNKWLYVSDNSTSRRNAFMPVDRESSKGKNCGIFILNFFPMHGKDYYVGFRPCTNRYSVICERPRFT